MRKLPRYCFWSVTTKPYVPLMQSCIDSARRVGVFSDFNVLTEQPLEGCSSYDLMEFQPQNGLFPVFYLKLGMAQLDYDYFVWIDADSRFNTPPLDLLSPVRRNPLHVPLKGLISDQGIERRYRLARLPRFYHQCSTAFWIVHRDLIDPIYELTRDYWKSNKTESFAPSWSETLGYAAHLLMADPEDHVLGSYGNTWGESCDEPVVVGAGECRRSVAPSIVHLGSGHSNPRLS